jgi:hypothetical protein
MSSNQARNIQFELLLAATLWRARLKVELAEPDLRCMIGELTILFACKRLFSLTKLNKRINAATDQLRRNLKLLAAENSFGMIAISLSRVFGTLEQAEVIANRREGRARLASAIDVLVLSRAKWHQTRQAQGIVFHLASVFNNTETSLIEPGSFLTLHGDGPVCEALAIRLQSLADI